MSADWIEAEEDADALRQVHGLVDGARFELWQRKRRVSPRDER